MRHLLATGFAILAATACKKDEPAVAPPAPGPASAAAVAAAADAKPAVPAVACLAVLSQAFRDKYFPGATITSTGGSHGVGEKCIVKHEATKLDMTIEWACDDTVNSVKAEMVKDIKDTFPEAKELPGVGETAIAAVLTTGETMFYVWDVICVGNGRAPAGVDAATFITDWLAQLPRK